MGSRHDSRIAPRGHEPACCGGATAVARASRLCESKQKRTGETPVPLPGSWKGFTPPFGGASLVGGWHADRKAVSAPFPASHRTPRRWRAIGTTWSHTPHSVAPLPRGDHLAPTARQTKRVRSRMKSRSPASAMGPQDSRPWRGCSVPSKLKPAGEASSKRSLPESLTA